MHRASNDLLWRGQWAAMQLEILSPWLPHIMIQEEPWHGEHLWDAKGSSLQMWDPPCMLRASLQGIQTS